MREPRWSPGKEALIAEMAYYPVLRVLLQSILTVVGMFVILVGMQPVLAVLALTVVPPIYLSAGYYARQIQPRVVDVRHRESMSLTIVHEAMQMMRVIVAFGREGYEWRRFRELKVSGFRTTCS